MTHIYSWGIILFNSTSTLGKIWNNTIDNSQRVLFCTVPPLFFLPLPFLEEKKERGQKYYRTEGDKL